MLESLLFVGCIGISVLWNGFVVWLLSRRRRRTSVNLDFRCIGVGFHRSLGGRTCFWFLLLLLLLFELLPVFLVLFLFFKSFSLLFGLDLLPASFLLFPLPSLFLFPLQLLLLLFFLLTRIALIRPRFDCDQICTRFTGFAQFAQEM